MELRGLVAAGVVLAFAAAAPSAHAVELQRPANDDVSPPGYTKTAHEVTAISARDEKVEAERGRDPSLRPTAYLRSPGRWQVSWFAGDDEVVQVYVDDSTGAVLELLVSVAGVAELPAQAISIVAATPLNFVGNKMWSFAHFSQRA